MSNYKDLWYESGDGLRLYARDYPCRNSPASACAVLCMHGLTRNSADFSGVADHLSERYRVISVDQRGRGRSDYDEKSANYAPAVYVQDMFTLLDQLGLQSVILVGTSMGGLMSMMMCAMQPDRIRGVVLNDIGPEVDNRGLDRIQGYVGKAAPVTNWEEAVAQQKAINGIAFPDFSEQEWQDFTRGVYRAQDGVPVIAYDAAIALPMADADSGAVPPDLWPLFEAISAIPMLVLRGETSDILAPDCIEGMRRRKSDLRVAVIPRRGHAPTLNEPASRTAIDEFLNTL
jgi:pimeloyl-ACP methyl ester carboxylesterase